MKGALTTALVFLVLIAPARSSAELPERASTVADRELVNVTIYNGGTALIHDRRRVNLEDGLNRIAWRDVSANIDATSALLEDLSSPDAIHVLEQNFDYDLLSPSALLQKYIGHNVTVVHDPRFAGERETRETARLLSAGDNGVILQYRNGIETDIRGHILFPTATGTFRDQPTLVLSVASERSASQTLDLSYLTEGLSWRADYVGRLASDERHLAITGLVTISNTSGTPYGDAHLQLVAGNVNVVQPQALMKNAVGAVSAEEAGAPAPVQQENYFEYHLYTFPRTTTILNNQTKQLTLLSASDVPVRKTLELRGSSYYYRSPNADLGDRLKVGVYVSFENKGGDLGIPLPGGIVRLYENDSRGLSQFLGSDTIEHTPRNETVRLHLGDSFDVTARKRQTDFHFIDNCSTSSSYEVVLSNAKTIAQDVLVVEQIPGQWTIAVENIPHVKSSATTAGWQVRVPADGRATLKYTANVTWCSR
ncbi:MAG: DUF4139 domain-containing protein [Candidatus Eremiobacteraeota bacterium]|nr:DUF4139 domain-containing protein [Candidatus Eremiobacteraeota bacterium]